MTNVYLANLQSGDAGSKALDAHEQALRGVLRARLGDAGTAAQAQIDAVVAAERARIARLVAGGADARAHLS